MANSDDEDVLFSSSRSLSNQQGKGLLGNKVKTIDDIMNGPKEDRRLKKTLALCASFLVLGLSIAVVGPTLLALQKHLSVEFPKMSYVFIGRSSGYLIGSVMGGVMFDYINTALLIGLTLLVSGIGMLLAPFCLQLWNLCAVMSAVGLAMGALDTGANVFCLRLWGKRSPPFLQALHFSFALGAFISPLLASPFIEVGNLTSTPLALEHSGGLSMATPQSDGMTTIVHLEATSEETPEKEQQTPGKDQEKPEKDQETHVKDQETPGKDKEPPGKNEETPGKDEEPPGKDEEPPGKDEESPGKDEESPGKDEETPGKDEEPPGKDEEPPGKDEEPPGKVEETPGKDEEPPGKDEEPPEKDEEPPGKNEETPGKDEEPPGKDEEPPGKDEEPPGKDEESPGKDEEPPGKDEEPPGKDEEPPGKDEEPPGKDEEPPGKDEEPPGKDEEPPGKDEEPPGKDEETPLAVSPGAPPMGGSDGHKRLRRNASEVNRPDDSIGTKISSLHNPASSKFQNVYIIIGIFTILVSCSFFYFYCTSPVKPPPGPKSEEDNESYTDFKNTILFLMFLFYFLEVGAEIGFGGYIFTFARVSDLNFSVSSATLLNAAFFGAFAIGRGLSICLAGALSARVMLIMDVTGCVLASLVLTLYGETVPIAVWVGTASLGLSMASLFPAGISWLESFCKVTGNMASILIIGSALGEMCFPMMIGWLFGKDPNHPEGIEQGPIGLMYIILAASCLTAILFVILQYLAKQNGVEYKEIPIAPNGIQDMLQGFEESFVMEELGPTPKKATKQISKPIIPKAIQVKKHRE
ncbi:sodium-dependent glucose transporter 1-like [Asterias rubens]|uniref:sodium-dependent glucose transporter 1-like n=1 Tax=Asterias rubens TaxID=7604 RepID=UPI00145523A3|nr:sodium-dependent glucose transporter 1-like [Asterias rubens]